MQASNLFIELGTDCNATGSATWELDSHQVTFSVYGPVEAKISEELTHRASVDVNIAPMVGLKSDKEREVESFLISLFERLVDVQSFPRLKLSCRITVINGESTDPRTVAAMVNAGCLAFLQSGLPMNTTIAAVCPDKPITASSMTFVVNMTHPSLTRASGDSGDPALFAVYTGDRSTGGEPSQQPYGIAFDEFLELIQVPDQLLSNSDQQRDSSLTNGIYKKALDLTDAMLLHIAASACIK